MNITYNTIVDYDEKIKDVECTIKDIKKDISTLNNTFKTINVNKFNTKDYNSILNKIKCKNDLLLFENIKLKIMEDNLNYLCAGYALPLAIDIFSSFIGKSYGIKTKEKISNLCFDKYKFNAYMSYSFGTVLHIYFGGKYRLPNLSFNTNNPDNTILLNNDNKICPAAVGDFYAYGVPKNFIDNETEQAIKIIDAFDQIKTECTTLNKYIAVYNELLPTDINSIYINTPNYIL